ncbi:hypothetical protein CYMTET_53708 [Cymbomonas tetramitiformis]|uniref:Uncharacterized protein n=1 Tax=Cymbomonas tetramitiformis TaxID=36881 RepID=A0AAE0BGH0_9CHLO|nr:hypothetical protein CYMTET_53708 [Cymbomonas tetramitiformis]|eukprot:gene13991-16536_t
MASFMLQCSDGAVKVNSDDASTMEGACDFFRAVFAHDTTEAEHRIISKLDWTTDTTSQLVKLLTTPPATDVKIPLTDLADLAQAADQLLIDLEVVPPNFSGDNRKSDHHTPAITPEAFLSRVAGDWALPAVWNFELANHCAYDIYQAWPKFLAHGIIVLETPEDDVLVSVFVRRPLRPNDNNEDGKSRQLDSLLIDITMSIGMLPFGTNHRLELRLCSNVLSIGESVLATRVILSDAQKTSMRNGKTFVSEEFSLRIPCWRRSFMTNRLIDELKARYGVRAYVHNKNSLGYYLDGGQESCPTFFGNAAQLSAVLQVFPESLMCDTLVSPTFHVNRKGARCALRVCAPTSESLTWLMSAVTKCIDNPLTLGLDISANAYFAVKTVPDMKLLLADLASSIAEARAMGSSLLQSIKIIELNYPKGVF